MGYPFSNNWKTQWASKPFPTFGNPEGVSFQQLETPRVHLSTLGVSKCWKDVPLVFPIVGKMYSWCFQLLERHPSRVSKYWKGFWGPWDFQLLERVPHLCFQLLEGGTLKVSNYWKGFAFGFPIVGKVSSFWVPRFANNCPHWTSNFWKAHPVQGSPQHKMKE